MPSHRSQTFWKVVVLPLILSWTVAVPSSQAQPNCEPDSTEPYIFLLFDTSGSMNWSPPCSVEQFNTGICNFLCPTGDCFVPLQSDDPGSKFYQVKEALFGAVSTHSATLFGFATFNQDDLRVRDKHWLYTASDTQPDASPNNFVSLLSGMFFPEIGAEEVFGFTWTCDEGSGDRERGCWGSSTKVADMNDPWELRRTRRLPKLGRDMDEQTVIYLRDPSDGRRYKLIYRSVATLPDGTPNTFGNAKLAADLEVRLCTNNSSNCSSMFVDRQILYYDLVSDFSSWDNGARRSQPRDGFFLQSNAADASALNTCAGSDGNDDTVDDLFAGYDLRFPTIPDPPPLRFDVDGDGIADLEDFSFGDVIPLDWEDDHRQDVLRRLAPNTALDPLAPPDFRVATYLNDLRQPGDSFLRLADENARPLTADGATPLGNSMRDFRDYLDGSLSDPGFFDIGELFDDEFACREKILIMLTDGENSCSGPSACTEASALYQQLGVRTYAVGFGMVGPSNTLDCIAANGGTGNAIRPQNGQELLDALNYILELHEPSP